jgi:hypothetical protein
MRNGRKENPINFLNGTSVGSIGPRNTAADQKAQAIAGIDDAAATRLMFPEPPAERDPRSRFAWSGNQTREGQSRPDWDWQLQEYREKLAQGEDPEPIKTRARSVLRQTLQGMSSMIRQYGFQGESTTTQAMMAQGQPAQGREVTKIERPA